MVSKMGLKESERLLTIAKDVYHSKNKSDLMFVVPSIDETVVDNQPSWQDHDLYEAHF